VHDPAGKPIRLAGEVISRKLNLFVLDATHPGAQEYLTKTYSTMARAWGIRSVKLDFMEDTCIEGVHYKPNTTAIEALRIGLQVIRDAVGNDVLLDKDGSIMLAPVGLVDTGRISQDTAHNFRAIQAAATGIAARYYMNRNYFVSDPDAFMVSRGDGKNPLSLDEAKVSLALSLVSGGMLEIGNGLPELSEQPERLALLKNPDVLAIAHNGKASIPIDLMSYRPEDLQPSIFLLKESGQPTILTVFNWSDTEQSRSLAPSTLGIEKEAAYGVHDILEAKDRESSQSGALSLHLAPHSVQMLRITQASRP
jgi:hypothetical protein